MIGYNAIGTDAIGTSGAGGVAASFSCSISAVASASVALTNKIVLAAALTATAIATANLTGTSAQLSASIPTTASTSASLRTGVTFASSFATIATATGSLKTGMGFASSLITSANSVGTLVSSTGLVANLTLSGNVTAVLTNADAVPMYVPSVARTIFVQSTSPVFTGSKWWNLTDAKKPRGLKDPDATIDITFDWSDWLNDIGAVTISDVTFTLKGGLANAATFYDTTKATVFVSGGVNGTPCTIACKIKTNTTPSRTDERTVYIDIGDE